MRAQNAGGLSGKSQSGWSPFRPSHEGMMRLADTMGAFKDFCEMAMGHGSKLGTPIIAGWWFGTCFFHFFSIYWEE